MASPETAVKSATSMASGGAGNAIIPASSTAEASQSNPASSTALPPVDPKGKGKRKKGDKPGKFRSEVWLHFEKIEKPVFETVDGKMQQVRTVTRAQCKYCSTDLACDPYDNGTSSLRRHIQDVCKKYPGRADIEKGQTLLGGDGSVSVSGEPNLAVKMWSQDRCRVAAVEMIVMDELPFSAIERKGFRHFCSVAVPKWEVPSRRTIVKLFLKMYDAKKVELRKELQSHSVCLTTDTWTSVQNINYMVLTAHFIDYGWKMHKRILNFCVISNHSGNSIGKLIESCLIQWGIERVLTISVDNAAANKHAIDYVRKKMVNWSKKPVLGGKFLHVRCLAHILNLIVRSGLTMLDRSVGSIRNAVKYVRSSSSRLEVFKKCVEKEKLESKKICVLDVPTRWNSTFIMLETALELKKAFYRMADEEDSKYDSYFDEPEPEEEDWDILMWWRLNGVKYPNLQLVAKDVLAIQVSTVASESAFSTGGRVIDPYRSSMTPRTVEALICMQNWINSTSISEIEYFPTTEEFEFYERMEKEHQLEDTASSEKARVGKLSKAAKITIDCDAAEASNTSS